MGIVEVVLIGIGLSMDAAAVSMTDGMVYRGIRMGKLLAIPACFGLFQALMPLLGFYAGSLFSFVIQKYSGVVILAILGIIGAKMVKDGIGRSVEERCVTKAFAWNVLLMQAFATSIDAFAVGIGFAVGGMEVWSAVGIIGVTTTILSLLAILLGRRFGDLLGPKAEIVGGIILIGIGIKAVLPV